jgi:hypothetical protein
LGDHDGDETPRLVGVLRTVRPVPSVLIRKIDDVGVTPTDRRETKASLEPSGDQSRSNQSHSPGRQFRIC